ncbi:hypothetical protein WA1_27190 [Scytonema hofmannii PCC 7110]|uniref:Uncharacterized protein n=1 Tax=Scytonema hofmannii PCC 7110 TaxID=128403 RepID=A0A139X6C0_9CYAN|nr:hypothetical protein [Scytonema hofmannii]KYC40224.1 hypothetical protein WA1_27190 [Scytonema hofmannii PCC 7110]
MKIVVDELLSKNITLYEDSYLLGNLTIGIDMTRDFSAISDRVPDSVVLARVSGGTTSNTPNTTEP